MNSSSSRAADSSFLRTHLSDVYVVAPVVGLLVVVAAVTMMHQLCMTQGSQCPPLLKVFAFAGICFLVTLACSALAVLCGSYSIGIPPVPTTRRVEAVVLALLPYSCTNVNDDETRQLRVVDVGSGFGTLARRVALHCPRCEVVGYESSLVPFYVSWLLSCGVPTLHFVRGDVLTPGVLDFKNFDVVLIYLFPEAMSQLRCRLEECKAGVVVISIVFSIPTWEAFKVKTVVDGPFTVYKYVYRRTLR